MKTIHFCALVTACCALFAPLHLRAALSVPAESAVMEVLRMSELGQVKNETGDPAFDWLSDAFIFYANWYLEPVSYVMTTKEAPRSFEDNPFPPLRIDAAYSLDGSALFFKIHLRGEGAAATERSLGGQPSNAAVWLADLRKIIEEYVPSGMRSGLTRSAPTSSTEALKSFIEASRLTDPKTAAETFQECLHLDPLFLEAHWRLGITLYFLENYVFAYDHFEAYSLKQPDFSPAVHNMALCLLKSGKTYLAAEQFQKLVELEPDSIEFRYLLARALFNAGRLQEAARAYHSIHNASPSEYKALLELAFIRGAKGDNTGAREAAGLAKQSVGTQAVKDLLIIGQRAWGSGDLDGALSAFSLTLYLDPDDFPSRLARGIIRYQEGEYDSAIIEFLEAIRLKNDDPDLFRYLGMSYQRVDKQEEASEFFRKSSELFTSRGPTDTVKNMIFASLSNTPDMSEAAPPLRYGRRAHTLTLEWFRNRVAAPSSGSASLPTSDEEDVLQTEDVTGSGSLEERVSFLEKELEDLALQNSSLSGKLKEKDEHLSTISAESSARLTELEALKAKYEALGSEKDNEIDAVTKQLEEMRSQSESSLKSEAAKVEKLNADLIAERETQTSLAGEIESLKAELATIRDRSIESEEFISGLKNKLTEQERLVETNENIISSLRTELHDTEVALSAISLDLDERQKKIASLSEGLEKRDEQISSLKNVTSAQETALAAFKNDTEVAKSEIPALKKKIAENESLVSSLKKELAKRDSLLEDKEALLKTGKTASEKLASELEAERKKILAVRAEGDERIASLTKEVDVCGSKIASLEKNIQSLNKEINSFGDKLTDKESALLEARSEMIASKETAAASEEKQARELDALKKELAKQDSLLEDKEALLKTGKAASEKLASELETERRSIKAMEAERSTLAAAKKASEDSLLSMQSEHAQQANQIEEKDTMISRLNQELEGERGTIVELQDQLKKREAEKSGLEKRFQDTSSLITALESTIETNREEIQALKEAAKNLENRNRETSLRVQTLMEERASSQREFEGHKAAWAAAEEEYRKLLSASLFKAAETYHARGEEEDALHLLEKLTSIKPGHADAYYLMGTIYLSRGEYAQASQYFDKSREIYGNFISEGPPGTGGP